MMRSLLNDCLLAISYFSRLPVTRWVHFSEAALNRAAGWFPLVGVLVGGLSALVLWLLDDLLGRELGVLLAMLVGVLLTGAFHEDGLADTADGFGPVGDREKALAVMKDSRLGTFGVLALMLVLGGKFLALSAFASLQTAVIAFIAAHVLSRFSVVPVIATQPFVRQSASRSRLVAQGLPAAAWLPALLVSALAMLALAWLLSWQALAGALLLSGLTVVWVVLAVRRRFGGYTGDTLGAMQQLSELAILCAILATTSSAV